jgi:predicted alpha/beta superfamily hydrolase
MRITFVLLIFLFSNFICGRHKVRFEVKQLPSLHSSDKIFIAGNFNNWDPSLNENSFSIDSKGNAYCEIQLSEGSYEYKFTRGGWNKVEVAPDGLDIANRNLLLQSDTIIHVSIKGWKDDFPSAPVTRKHSASNQVKILDSAFKIPQLSKTRKIWIYLPKDYFQSKKRYPVIYMHDGQNVFDEATSAFGGEWGIDEYFDSLSVRKESIVVAVANGESKRMNEYNPYNFKQYGKGEGNEYVDFLVQILKPYVDKQFHTLTDKANTFIAGSSMGGLISLYAVLKYPSVFGGAGIFSPAFWTANGIDKDISSLAPKVNSKLFFYAGEKESDEMVSDMKRIEKEIQAVSKAPILEKIDSEAKHNEAAWRKHFPYFYEWIHNN